MKSNILKGVGAMCKQFRERQGYTQADVARQTGYSEQNVSSFETGRTNNMILLLWYIDHGIFTSFSYNYKYRLHRLLTEDDKK